MTQDILIVIEDGVFSHGHSFTDASIYIVDMDTQADDPILGACYTPADDSQCHATLEEIDEKFGTEYESESL